MRCYSPSPSGNLHQPSVAMTIVNTQNGGRGAVQRPPQVAANWCNGPVNAQSTVLDWYIPYDSQLDASNAVQHLPLHYQTPCGLVRWSQMLRRTADEQTCRLRDPSDAVRHVPIRRQLRLCGMYRLIVAPLHGPEPRQPPDHLVLLTQLHAASLQNQSATLT
jgi:hypothetical protein